MKFIAQFKKQNAAKPLKEKPLNKEKATPLKETNRL